MSQTTSLTIETARRGQGFIIGSVTVDRYGKLTFSTSDTPAVHGTLDAARAEAERLARQHPGKYFVPLAIRGAVVAQSVSWS